MINMVAILRQFAEHDLDAPAFVKSYQNVWVSFRDSKERSNVKDEKVLDALDRAFTAADCYKPENIEFRLESDIDENTLRADVAALLEQLSDK